MKLLYTEKLVPFMAIIYMVCSIIVCIFHIDRFGAVFTSIFKSAFGMRAVGGGIVGSGVAMHGIFQIPSTE